MSLQKITFTNSTVSAQKDADFYYFLLNDIGVLRGIKHGLQVTNNVNRIVFKSGYVNIYGRMLFIEEDTTVTIPLDQVAYGYVIIRVNTSNNTAELTYKEGTANYPDLTQENIMQEFGIYEFALAKYSKTSTNLALQEFTPKYIYRKESSYLGTENKDKVLIVGNDGYIALQSKDDILVGKAKADEKGTNIANKFSSIDSSINDVNNDLIAHKDNTLNPHKVTKSQVGLGNVDNTSDLAKPISIATQNALNTKVTAESNKGLVTQQILANTDLNTVKTNGFYGVSQSCTNKPANKDDGNLIVLQYDSSNLWTTQVYITLNLSENKNRIYSRGYNNSTNSWSSWKQIDNDPSLYNLGAYDTYVDNGDGTTTITRQTGYWNSNNATVNVAESYHYTNGMRVQYDKVSNIDSGEGEGKAKSNWAYGFEMISKPSNINYNSTAIWLGFPYIFVNGKADLTSALEYINKNPVSIEYKLATPYTETIITGVPQITLDKQGCEWLRSEWEKGLNLFNMPDSSQTFKGVTKNIQNNCHILLHGSTTGNEESGRFNLQLEPGIYTFSNKIISGSGDTMRLVFHDYDWNWQKTLLLGDNNSTATITNSEKEVICSFYQDDNRSYNYLTLGIMLNKGTKALPYAAYNGSIVHEKQLSLKTPSMGSKVANECMMNVTGAGQNNSNSDKYILLGTMTAPYSTARDGGVIINGTIGDYSPNIQAQINAVAYWRSVAHWSGSYTKTGSAFFSCDLIITSTYRIYLVLRASAYYQYNLQLQGKTIQYTGVVLDTIDGSIASTFSQSEAINLTALPGRSLYVNTITMYFMSPDKAVVTLTILDTLPHDDPSSGTSWSFVRDYLNNEGYVLGSYTNWQKTNKVYPCSGSINISSSVQFPIVGISKDSATNGLFWLHYLAYDGSPVAIAFSTVISSRAHSIQIF